MLSPFSMSPLDEFLKKLQFVTQALVIYWNNANESDASRLRIISGQGKITTFKVSYAQNEHLNTFLMSEFIVKMSTIIYRGERTGATDCSFTATAQHFLKWFLNSFPFPFILTILC